MSFNRQTQNQPEGVSILTVRGWQQSKASGNDDGGVQSLKTFLSKKASRPVQNAYVQGDALIVTVKASDEHRFTHLNNFTWAGTTLEVTLQSSSNQPTSKPNNHSTHHLNNQNRTPSGPRNNSQRFNTPNGQSPRNTPFNQSGSGQNVQLRNNDNVTMSSSPFSQSNNASTTSDKDALTQVIASVIRKRYNAGQKYLTLESLAADPDFIQSGLSSSTASKVFAAVFTTAEKHVFETPTKRQQMVESLSLSNNGLTTVRDVIAASSTFSNIKNLDLSNNNISDTSELRFWRNRFPNLEHLILSGNPVALKPDTKDIMKRWYSKLKLYNNEQIRGDGAFQSNLQAPTPPQSTSPINPLPTEPHPEFGPDSTFGVPQPGKSDEQLLKEQMGLKFSYETRLKMQYVEMCLSANSFNWEAAMADLQASLAAGKVPADAFLQV